MKKLLIVCSTLDLDHPHNATPALWQLFKGLYEIGCQPIIIPYRGRAIRSLWWACYENPCRMEGELYFSMRKIFRKNPVNRGSANSKSEKIIPKLAQLLINPKWKSRLNTVFNFEREIDALIFVGIPLNQIKGVASFVRKRYNVPVLYYDLDVPTSFPENGGFKFNYYVGADLSEYDAFIIPSEGSSTRLLELGAQKVFILYFGVDPAAYVPIELKHDIDVGFFGGGSRNREHFIDMMITKPSMKLPSKFLTIGRNFNVNLGRSILIPVIRFNDWRKYSCRSKINLNIPRENHARTYATSTSRPFELGAMDCCIVSSPYHGLEKWFDVGREILVVKSAEEAIDTYQWLLEDEEARRKFGKLARERVCKEHTHIHRAKELLQILDSIS